MCKKKKIKSCHTSFVSAMRGWLNVRLTCNFQCLIYETYEDVEGTGIGIWFHISKEAKNGKKDIIRFLVWTKSFLG